MIRPSYCPKCCKITNQKITKSLKATTTVCLECQSTTSIEYKPRIRLHSVSDKMAKQKREERKLTAKLFIASNGLCEICGSKGYPFGLHKHEIIRRGQQGNEIDPLNCLLLCIKCHNHVLNPKTGTPLSIELQLALANRLHKNLTITD